MQKDLPEKSENFMDSTPVNIVVVGHVDHGKSTVIGRMLHDTGSLPDGKIENIKAVCEKRGMPFEWAFVMDALKAEKDQGITIEAARIRFKTRMREYVLLDAPGHKEFLKNMVTGASNADAAVLVVDAREGVREQTKRHAYLLHLLGIRQVMVVINKMDLVYYSEKRYREVAGDTLAYLSTLGLLPTDVIVVPVSARGGDNIAGRSEEIEWYEGPTMTESLDRFRPPVSLGEMPLRFPVQDIYKFDDRRIIAGRIETGRLRVGDELSFSPSCKTAKIKTIEAWNIKGEVLAAGAGQSIGVTLDEQIFIERGEIASLKINEPMLSNVFLARLFWLGNQPLEKGNRYKLKIATAEYDVEVEEIKKIIDVDSLSSSSGEKVERNGVAEVVFRSKSLMSVDPFTDNIRTGRFVVQHEYNIVGGGLISMEGYADQRAALTVKSTNLCWVDYPVERKDRWRVNKHKSGILWLTGLSGAGKSTIAIAIEQELFRKGCQAYVLDGDNIRHGLCADLAFSPEDRTENIRRVGETAKLFADAGFIVITAFISPYCSDRDRVRFIAEDDFHEVFVKADLITCEHRDPKGLYKKARKGEIKEFTGISAPYEAPLNPELVLDTQNKDIDGCVEIIMDYIKKNFLS